MFSHIMVGSNDLEKSKKFYDAIFAAIGGEAGAAVDDKRVAYVHNGGRFVLTKPIDGQPATHANGGTIGIGMTAAQCDAWHAAGVANGGTSCEDPPGWRDGAMGKIYLAYLRDPDGNKLCAVDWNR